MTDPGWTFWVEHKGTIRNFAVGEANEDTAKLAVQREHPDVNFLEFVSKQRLSPDLIKMLRIAGGKVMEWVAADGRSEIQPRGGDIDSDHDPYRR